MKPSTTRPPRRGSVRGDFGGDLRGKRGRGGETIESLASGSLVAAIGVLGLSAGALLAEAAVLVPFWKGLPPADFLAWYRRHAGLLLRFFGPLEVAAALLAGAAALLGAAVGSAAAPGLGLSAVLALAVLAAFPLYFKQANGRFARGDLPTQEVGPELERWARWHALRTVVATAAFATALLAGLE